MREPTPDDNLGQLVSDSIDSFSRRAFHSFRGIFLDEDDLRKQGVIPGDITMFSFLKEQLGLTHSIQREVAGQLLKALPGVGEKDDSQLPDGVSLDQELAVRAAAIEGRSEILSALIPESMRDFTGKVLDGAGVLYTQDSQGRTRRVSANIEKIRSDDPALYALILLTQVPQLFRDQNDNMVFTVQVPANMAKAGDSVFDDNVFHPIDKRGKIYEPENTIIVSDSEKNHELSEYLINHPEILNFYLAMEVYLKQEEIAEEVTGLFRQTASFKDRKTAEIIQQVNNPLKTHLFDLMLNSVNKSENAGFDILNIHRTQEVADRLRTGNITKQQASDGSHITTFHITAGDEDSLKFELPEGENLYDKLAGNTQVYVKKDASKEGTLLFGIKEKDGVISWNSSGSRDSETKTIEEFFSEIELLNKIDFIRDDEAALKEAKQALVELQETRNLVEFFALVRNFKIADYPQVENIVSTTQAPVHVLSFLDGLGSPPDRNLN